MAKHILLTSRALKATLHLLLLAIALRCVHAARILTEEHADPPVMVPAPEAPDMAPVAGPAATIPTAASPLTTTTSATVADEHPPLSFFMHDILGGSNPTARVEAGIIANTQINGLPFTKTNGGVFPMNGGVPLVTANGVINKNGITNNNNLPFLAGLNGASTSTVVQNNGNNNVVTNGDTLPFVTPGQLPAGATLQKLMFGTITVIDDELTEGHEIGSSVVGRAQGFYLASSLDGNSQTMAFTALFHEGDHHEEDTLSFFGVHRTAAPESQIAIVGGTGKYENANGYASIQTLHPTDQHTTDGVETLLHVSVFISDQ
ncbi:dirigent protein 24-like [Vitis riparia]|uniref:dirigent protein 24-like n=1 Tax=Vitis riparia TaxID=96939 RepID=UPI00155A8DAE|nr:dirigent protein 24-like [Vitis riparia]